MATFQDLKIQHFWEKPVQWITCTEIVVVWEPYIFDHFLSKLRIESYLETFFITFTLKPPQYCQNMIFRSIKWGIQMLHQPLMLISPYTNTTNNVILQFISIRLYESYLRKLILQWIICIFPFAISIENSGFFLESNRHIRMRLCKSEYGQKWTRFDIQDVPAFIFMQTNLHMYNRWLLVAVD